MKADAALERLRELAREAAKRTHNVTWPRGEHNASDSDEAFKTCPHPDCLLVRAVPQAPEFRFCKHCGSNVCDCHTALSPAPSGEPPPGFRPTPDDYLRQEQLIVKLQADIERLRAAPSGEPVDLELVVTELRKARARMKRGGGVPAQVRAKLRAIDMAIAEVERLRGAAVPSKD